MYSRVNPLRLEITPPEDVSPEPTIQLDTELIRKHCAGIEADDSLFDIYLKASIQRFEKGTNITIIPRPHRWILEDFPRTGDHSIKLPRGKTLLVESIEYSSSGSTVTLYGPSSTLSPSGGDFQEDLSGDEGGIVMPLRSGSWPTPDFDVPNPVAINFTAGYEIIPEDIQRILLFSISEMYEQRGPADMVDTNPAMLNVFDMLINPYKDRFVL